MTGTDHENRDDLSVFVVPGVLALMFVLGMAAHATLWVMVITFGILGVAVIVGLYRWRNTPIGVSRTSAPGYADATLDELFG